jgi:hypothetical protein
MGKIGRGSQMDTKTDWPTDYRSECDFHLILVSIRGRRNGRRNLSQCASISEEQAVPAVFLAATPLADCESSAATASKSRQSLQELRLYQPREPALSRAWQHLCRCLIAYRYRHPQDDVVLLLFSIRVKIHL